MPAVLVTGATGFVGRVACAALHAKGWTVKAVVRDARGSACRAPSEAQPVIVDSIGPDTDWGSTLEHVEVIVHLAARAHVLKETAKDPVASFRRVNIAGTERLARAAAGAGVQRLVFVSTIKVNGEETPGTPFTEDDPPSPQDAYGLSKWKAEQALRRVAAETGLEVVILRPPLVYGPGVKGNFLRLLELVNRGTPLPLGSVRNRRSLVFVGNLVDAIIACATHPKAAGKTFLVSDDEDLSIADLISRIAQALDRPDPLWPFPPTLLRLAGNLLGKSEEARRLLGSLRVDSGRIRRELDWAPPYSTADGLARTAHWFLALGAAGVTA